MKKILFKRHVFYMILGLIILMAYPVAYKMSAETIKITVTGKERITTGSGENITNKFIIYTETEVFENTDSWLFFKFNSADYQSNLKVGETYMVKVVGWRIPFFSKYRNIIDKNN